MSDVEISKQAEYVADVELSRRRPGPSCPSPWEMAQMGLPQSGNLPGSRVFPSGTTSKFGTGAVRSDTVEEFRYDLVSPIGLREVARACAEGAEKYGDWNWEQGMPVHDLLNHAIAHVYQFLAGDRSESHLGHAAWNLLAAIHSNELWPHLNDRTLRSDGCRPPGGQFAFHQEARDALAEPTAVDGRRLCPDGAPSEESRPSELLDRHERPTCGRCGSVVG